MSAVTADKSSTMTLAKVDESSDVDFSEGKIEDSPMTLLTERVS